MPRLHPLVWVLIACVVGRLLGYALGLAMKGRDESALKALPYVFVGSMAIVGCIYWRNRRSGKR
jgi:hypothetical protein